MARRWPRLVVHVVSSFVVVDRRCAPVTVVGAAPLDADLAEAVGLVDLDEALLVQLEHGEEADDDVEPLDQLATSAGRT